MSVKSRAAPMGRSRFRLNSLTRLQRRDLPGGIVFVLPAAAFLILTSLYPLLYALILTFFRWDLKVSPNASFVALQNYVDAFQDPEFANSLSVTLIFVIVTVAAETILGMAIALLVTREGSQLRVVRSLLLIPMVMTPVVVGVLWRMLFNPDFGLINWLLTLVGLPVQQWLGNPDIALWSVMITDIWEWTPFVVLCFVAGIISLPPELERAARVDGASKWQIFWRINLPLLQPVILVVVLLRFLDAFKVVDTVYVMTYGGPGNSTKLLSFFIYETGLKYFNIGYASTISWLFIVLMFILSGYLIRQRQKLGQL